MSDSKFKQDVQKVIIDIYNWFDSMVKLDDSIDKDFKENKAPWIAEQIETLAQNYTKEQDKEVK